MSVLGLRTTKDQTDKRAPGGQKQKRSKSKGRRHTASSAHWSPLGTYLQRQGRFSVITASSVTLPLSLSSAISVLGRSSSEEACPSLPTARDCRGSSPGKITFHSPDSGRNKVPDQESGINPHSVPEAQRRKQRVRPSSNPNSTPHRLTVLPQHPAFGVGGTIAQQGGPSWVDPICSPQVLPGVISEQSLE